ncbi:nitroreductase family protein [Actinophytocola oryzae]|uniref:Dihydropteridine reductase n=1 Tax=Actinophytocola oryzae TaxID=502181 RepID=A0A4R7VRN3_9PSEU|nr:nitroreductase family protein [Actinophytocola oryzae]TDV51877.1 dihydropteridine reductase [Actinophytocola oryzae]
MDLNTLAAKGHLARGFDPSRPVADQTVDQILEFLRSTPSSVSVQPWRALVLRTPESRQRLADHLGIDFEGNIRKIRTASHVLIISTLTDLSDETLNLRFAREEADGRFPDAGVNAAWQAMVREFVQERRYDHKDLPHWMEKQTYLAVGMTMMAAAAVGVDAAPLEGFNARTVDTEFGIRGTGYTTTLILALGYRDTSLTVAGAKSRLRRDELFAFVD